MTLLVRNILNLRSSPSNVICRKNIYTTPRLSSDMLLVHRDSKENNSKIPFQFTEANMKRIQALVQNYPEGSQMSAVSMALDIVQRQIGWIPISAMHKVAEILSMPRMRVYEWATFYTMCKREYRGKFNVKVCKTLPCMLRGSDIILQAVEDATCCKVGGLSEDKMFGVDLVECQGACANAPVVVIDDDYYEDLTVCDIYNIIQTLRCGGIPPCGPQSGRFAAEPCCGLTSLLTCPPPPGYCIQRALFTSCDDGKKKK
ncbi:NADH dehydrogenase [ubiquinone] flavoprotein 2, mitochondrial-like isoform X1 [Spodoptera frugiperda]|uniref:NADH dehydrogenase [ubiquinone] flavoprotein 2, mitochondrial-like isoform X1 n=1 Tax=Spodoptera frugiperda TaxID=7108 RepID=A0A9R0DX32_SPOFR|nr:NADH dehydrogenase [ubiquinone] flavoprotein 2, mitochondrial-like isoform X1 [Spodoptera frugiperda]